jgi:hypothetical protein
MEQPPHEHLTPGTDTSIVIITPTEPTATLAEARHLIVRLLAGAPDAVAVRAAAAALASIDDVTPPHPQLPEDVEPVDWMAGRPEALRLLTRSLDEADSVDALMRIGLAALELRRAGDAAEPGR